MTRPLPEPLDESISEQLDIINTAFRVTEAACMAHARCKIHDVHVRHPTVVTTEALNRIGALYAIESKIRSSPAEERLTARKARSVPLMQSLFGWI